MGKAYEIVSIARVGVANMGEAHSRKACNINKPRKPVVDESVTMSEGLITHVKEMYAKRMDEIMAQIMKDSRK